MSEKGLRYNNNKLRYDLLEPYAVEKLVEVFTAGANKYAPRNWEKGMNWSTVIASLKRHIADFEKGNDYDAESGLLTIAHAAWNAMALVSYYKLAPHLDDRQHSYLKSKRIGIDIDECIADFTTGYSSKLLANGDIVSSSPDHWSYCYNIMLNFEKWKEDNSINKFYEDLNPLVAGENFPFEPHCYITNRPVESIITEQWLKNNNFPTAKVFTVKNREEKVKIALNEKLDFFIDDNFSTFVDMNKAGILCLLMDSPHNKKYDVGFKRITNFEDFKERFL